MAIHDTVETTVTKPESTIQKVNKVDNNIVKHETLVTEEVQETISDEGWQEANPKMRSGNSGAKKFNRRKPELTRLHINGSEKSSNKVQKVTPRPSLTELTQSKPSKASVTRISPRISPSVATLNSMASKSVSYKEVAVAPPGTILKPVLEKVEEVQEQEKVKNDENQEEVKIEERDVDDVIPDDEVIKEVDIVHETAQKSEKSAEETEEDAESRTNKSESKLSASAQPFSPAAVPLTPNVYDAIASQATLAEPVGFPPIAARVPCGPRSPLYYRMSQSFRMKNGFLKYQIPGSGFGNTPRIMNPHAPEFVPKQKVEKSEDEKLRKTSSDEEKAELARQILLSFIVKSVHDNSETKPEPEPEPALVNEKRPEYSDGSNEAITEDSAIIKILYGNEGQKETNDTENNKNGDEGFVMVTKRRRNKQQFASGVNGVYNNHSQQQSVSASVR